MRSLTIVVIFASLGVSLYWNYKTSRELEAQKKVLAKKEEDLISQDSGKPEQRRFRSVEDRRQVQARLTRERQNLELITLELNRAKNVGTDQDNVNQITREVKDQSQIIKSLDSQIQSAQTQLASAKNHKKLSYEQQKIAYDQQSTALKLQIQTITTQVHTNETEMLELRRKKDPDSINRLNALKEQLQVLLNQKKQLDLDWASHRTNSDLQHNSEQEQLQTELDELKQKREIEKHKLEAMNQSLSQAKGFQTNTTHELDGLNRKYQDEIKKVRDLEQQLDQ